jgi:hypothetical protein
VTTEDDLGPIRSTYKSGSECLTDGGRELGPTLLDMWRWSASNLISNVERGRLAEFIVACALGIRTSRVHPNWGAWDLTLHDPEVRIEVKTSAYLQEWRQNEFTSPNWGTRTALHRRNRRRHSDVYVFALHAHRRGCTIDPLDVSQWRFFVVPTWKIDARNSNSISIGPLRRLSRATGGELRYSQLLDAVRRASEPRNP